jgi:hypothetical protein
MSRQICGYRRGGSQCGRPAVAVMRMGVDHHDLTHAGYRLCTDHLLDVVGTQSTDPRRAAGLHTVIEWLDGVSGVRGRSTPL